MNAGSGGSATPWVIAAFLYDETLGAITPRVVKDELKTWLGNVQNASGGVCIKPSVEPCDHADTGGWLLAMKFVGYSLPNSQLRSALTFLNTHWQSTADNGSTTNFGNPATMWTIYRGLETTIGLNDSVHMVSVLAGCGGITNDQPGSPSKSVPCTWSEDYDQWLVDNQKVDGSWDGVFVFDRSDGNCFLCQYSGRHPDSHQTLQLSTEPKLLEEYAWVLAGVLS